MGRTSPVSSSRPSPRGRADRWARIKMGAGRVCEREGRRSPPPPSRGGGARRGAKPRQVALARHADPGRVLRAAVLVRLPPAGANIIIICANYYNLRKSSYFAPGRVLRAAVLVRLPPARPASRARSTPHSGMRAVARPLTFSLARVLALSPSPILHSLSRLPSLLHLAPVHGLHIGSDTARQIICPLLIEVHAQVQAKICAVCNGISCLLSRRYSAFFRISGNIE